MKLFLLLSFFFFASPQITNGEEQETYDSLIIKATEGDSDACLKIGIMYARGEGGVKKNNSSAVWWIKKSVEKGNTEAMIRLGCHYWFGDGIYESKNKAIETILDAVEKGDCKAAYVLLNLIYDKYEEDLASPFFDKSFIKKTLPIVEKCNKMLIELKDIDLLKKIKRRQNVILELLEKKMEQASNPPAIQKPKRQVVRIVHDAPTQKVYISEKGAKKIKESYGYVYFTWKASVKNPSKTESEGWLTVEIRDGSGYKIDGAGAVKFKLKPGEEKEFTKDSLIEKKLWRQGNKFEFILE